MAEEMSPEVLVEEGTGGERLANFLSSLEEITPTIPDSLTSYYLQKSGFTTMDARLVRLVSLAAQKFISEISNDALQHCKMTGVGQTAKKNSKEKLCCLTVETLQPALADSGISVRKPPYYS